MKKVSFLLFLQVFVASLFATVDLTAVDNEAEGIDIIYDCTMGEVIRGVSLKVSIAGGEAIAVTLNPNLNAYIDYNYVYGVGFELPGAGATSVALVDAPGPMALPAAEFVISAGVLNKVQEGLMGSGIIGTIDVSYDDEACVKIEADPLRGGVVGDGVIDVIYPAEVCISNRPPSICDEFNLAKKKGGQTDNVCNVSDLNFLITYINCNKAGPFFAIPCSSPYYDPDYDFNKDCMINVVDINYLIQFINNNKTGPFFAVICE